MLRVSSSRMVWVTAVAALAISGLLVAVYSAAHSSGGFCDDQSHFPMRTVSCQLLVQHGMQIEAADPSSLRLPTDSQSAEAAALAANPGARVLESHLVRVTRPGDPVPSGAPALVWVVALALPDGIYISGGGYYMSELQKLRPNLNLQQSPLTDAERQALDDAVQARIAAQRASFVEQYHLDFIDSVTGQWLWAAEGAR